MIGVSGRGHRTWGDGVRAALLAAEFAVLVLLVSVALLTVLYVVALMSL
jgi:hypothetical protein